MEEAEAHLMAELRARLDATTVGAPAFFASSHPCLPSLRVCITSRGAGSLPYDVASLLSSLSLPPLPSALACHPPSPPFPLPSLPMPLLRMWEPW